MLMFDAVDPFERVKIAGQIAMEIAAMATAGAMEKVRIAGRLVELLARLGKEIPAASAPEPIIPSSWTDKLLMDAEPRDVVLPEQVRQQYEAREGMFKHAKMRGEPSEADIQQQIDLLKAGRMGKHFERGTMLKQGDAWERDMALAFDMLAQARTLVSIGTRKNAQTPDGLTQVGTPYFERAQRFQNGANGALASALATAAFMEALKRREANRQDGSSASFDKHLEETPAHPGKTYEDYLEATEGNVAKAAVNYYTAELQGDFVETSIGIVRLTGKGKSKFKGKLEGNVLRAALVEHIVDILRTGKVGGPNPPSKDRHDDMEAFYFFTKDVQIGENLVTAGVQVGLDRMGRLFYNITHSEMGAWKKKSATLDSTTKSACFTKIGAGVEPHDFSVANDGRLNTNFPWDASAALDAAAESEDDDDLNITILAIRPIAKGTAPQPSRLKSFGWDAVKLSDYSLEQLNQLRQQVEAEHANPLDAEGHPLENGRPTIYLYDKKGRWKLDKLNWAVTYKLQQQKAAETAGSAGRAPAGGTIGMNGEFYKGGSFLPNTALPKGTTSSRSTGTGRQLIEPGVWGDPPQPGASALFGPNREFLVSDGEGRIKVDPAKSDEVIANFFGEDGRALLNAYVREYNAGKRWRMPGEEIKPQPEDYQPAAEPPALELIEHTTGRGKVIRGIVRKDLTYAEAKALDEYTFRKDGGYFIRERHLEAMGITAAGGKSIADKLQDLAERRAPDDPEAELRRLEALAQAEADRIANQQLRERQKREQQVAKLRDVAASTLEKAEDTINADRKTNTARRASMAASILSRAEADRAMALTLNNLADAIERGQATHLSGVTSKAQVQTLKELLRTAMSELDHKLPYADQLARKGRAPDSNDVAQARLPRISMRYDYSNAINALTEKRPKGYQALLRELRTTDAVDVPPELFARLRTALESVGKLSALNWYSDEQAAKRARLARMGITTDQELRAALGEYLEFREGARPEDPVKAAERAIIGQKVGIDFFPTPAGLAQRMARIARIKEGDRVLEPSAGNGNLADAAKAAGAQVDVIEISGELRKILDAKGYNVVGHDFDSFTPDGLYDALIMNPPFRSRLDAQHIMRAFEMVKPGGRLVSIAGEGVFIGSDGKAQAFRAWLDQHGAEVEPLEQGTFKDASLLATTGANARLITLRR